jgi:hypothetical protein
MLQATSANCSNVDHFSENDNIRMVSRAAGYGSIEHQESLPQCKIKLKISQSNATKKVKGKPFTPQLWSS